MAELSRDVYDAAVRGEHSRKRAARTGMVGRRKLWSSGEIAALLRLYPDYRALAEALPGRTMKAIEYRAHSLNLQRRRVVPWTGADVSRLRRMWGRSSRDELLAAFPSRTMRALEHYASRRGIRAPKPKLKSSGYAIVDSIRFRARELGYTMKDLDEFARTKNYFHRAGWRRDSRPRAVAISRAVEALGGTLIVDWGDDD